MRAAPEVSAARRAERRKKARERGKNPCPKGLLRDGWHLMLTNLNKEQADVRQLVTTYRARWEVEIRFRAGRKRSTSATPSIARATNIICKHWYWQG